MDEKNTAIVIGAGLAGLLTARVLSEHFDRVTVLERDASGERRGAAQARQSHAILTVGRDLLEEWFPGLTRELLASGAVDLRAEDVVWHQNGSYRVRASFTPFALSMTAPLLERTLRALLLEQRPNVSIETNTAVDTLLVTDGRVTGVRVDRTERGADFVVACTGRNTLLLDQLAEHGFPAPEISTIHIDLACGSCLVERRPGVLDGEFAVVVEHPTARHRIAVMAPVEDDQWLITIGAFHGDAIPTDPDDYQQFLRSLPSPVIANVLSQTKATSPVLSYRMVNQQRRRVERLRDVPAGFVVLGDAIASLNPLYGQGAAMAALQARALDQALRGHDYSGPELVRDFYRRASIALDVAWQMAGGGEFRDPRTTGTRPLGIRLVVRYLDLVFLASHTSVRVADQALRVQNMLAAPTTLMTPAMVVRVLLAARRSPAWRPRSVFRRRGNQP